MNRRLRDRRLRINVTRSLAGVALGLLMAPARVLDIDVAARVEAAHMAVLDCSMPDIFATLYHNLGINPFGTTIVDPSGRPQYLLDSGKRLQEVL